MTIVPFYDTNSKHGTLGWCKHFQILHKIKRVQGKIYSFYCSTGSGVYLDSKLSSMLCKDTANIKQPYFHYTRLLFLIRLDFPSQIPDPYIDCLSSREMYADAKHMFTNLPKQEGIIHNLLRSFFIAVQIVQVA